MSDSTIIRSQLELDLIDILQLDINGEETNDQIIIDLINNGRQSLLSHEDDILHDTFINEMKDNSQLLKILKESITNHWSLTFYPSYSWFHSFIEESKAISFNLYDEILTRSAEYGRKKFIKSNDNGEQILFILIQFLFNLNNERMMDGYTFNRIWYILITTGLQGLQHLEEFIELKEIAKNQEILLYALKEYFRPELFSILSKCNIVDCRGLYNFILDNIAEYGWRLGLDQIRNRITPRMFKQVLNDIEILVPNPKLKLSTNDFQNKYLTINDKLLNMKVWSRAGEFNSLLLIIKSIIDRYNQHRTLTLFLHDCFIPLMYLLKREENLENFLQLLQQSCYDLSIDYTNISLRTLIHVLLSNSDESLRRIIIKQLNKQNIVPFLQPGNLNINFDILSIWDYTRPCLLSFGIGPCQGKSTLLNHIFHTKFEEHNKENIYFQQTIDIDFSPKSSFNIADAHGIITKECLRRFQSIFSGFLIHIDENYMKQCPLELNEYLSLIEINKFRLMFIHNSKTKKILYNKPNIVLPNLININDRLKQLMMKDIREEIYKRLKDLNINQERIQIEMEELSTDYRLINEFIKNFLAKLSLGKKPWKNENEFPFYVKFCNLCKQRQQRRRQAFIQVKENIGETLEGFDQIYLQKLRDDKEKSKEESVSLGSAFEIFVELLQIQTVRRLLILDYLSLKLTNYVSLEILWRNVIICYDQCSSSSIQACIVNAYLDLIKAGLPFEIINGDDFYLPYRFLKEIFMNSNENGQRRILVISIIGPKQTGKSILLQNLFGIQIIKRSTRGLYGSLIKSNVDTFNYILVLDIEGFDQGDDEYDRRMTLFSMSVSHIVILNVSNDIPDRFMNILSICNDSLKRLIGNHQSSIIHLVVNRISSLSITSDKTVRQYQQDLISNSNLHIKHDAIHFLSIPYQRSSSIEPLCSECTQDLWMKISHSSLRLRSTTLSEWLNTAILFFDVLQEKPAFSCFENLTEYLSDDSILDYIRQLFYEYLTFTHQQKLMDSVLDKSYIEIDQIFNLNILETRDKLQNQLNDRLNIIKASESIRERSKNFLQRQVYEKIDGWRLAAIDEANCRQFSLEKNQNSQKNKSNKKERETKK